MDQNPRPPSPKEAKDSHKIRKPPLPPPAPPNWRPVIIYEVAPQVHHTNPSEFRGLVQRLTGLPNPTADATCHFASGSGASSSPAALPPPETERTRMPLVGNDNSMITSQMHSQSNPGWGTVQGISPPEPDPTLPGSPTLMLPDPNPNPFPSLEHQQYPDYDEWWPREY